jgi:hypothetical protein
METQAQQPQSNGQHAPLVSSGKIIAATGLQLGLSESPTLGKLAAALAKAQGQMNAASKSAFNPYYGSKYADLASVWDVIRKPLSDNGLAVVQRVTTSVAPPTVSVETMLIHQESGEYVRDSCSVPVLPQQRKDGSETRITAQSFGSAISYARRYSLSALVGVAAEDDDGNGASDPPPNHREPPPSRPQSKTEQTKAKLAAKTGDLKARAIALWHRAEKSGADQKAFQGWAEGTLGKRGPSSDWTAEDLDKLEAQFSLGFGGA